MSQSLTRSGGLRDTYCHGGSSVPAAICLNVVDTKQKHFSFKDNTAAAIGCAVS